MINIKKAFTLVELIVVITILAILWTIAFLSFQWYSRDARDSVRTSDIDNIRSSLELYSVSTWKFPDPSWSISITYSWAEIWSQWTIWDSVIKNLQRLSKKPLDPLSLNEYTYSRLSSKKEYELWAILEWDVFWYSPVTQVNAATAPTSYISWNYNWIIAQVSTWAISTTTYILAIPTIITTDISWALTDLTVTSILTNKKLAYNWSTKL